MDPTPGIASVKFIRRAFYFLKGDLPIVIFFWDMRRVDKVQEKILKVQMSRSRVLKTGPSLQACQYRCVGLREATAQPKHAPMPHAIIVSIET
jgi:hypothetical protein